MSDLVYFLKKSQQIVAISLYKMFSVKGTRVNFDVQVIIATHLLM